jgi:uncharacterized membrane protein YhaH (DUF805 family)
MNFGQAIKSVLKNYANFKGRARRSEYWYWQLFYILIQVPFMIIGLAIIPNLLLFLPSLSVEWRRLHDVGKSGARALITTILSYVFIISSNYNSIPLNNYVSNNNDQTLSYTLIGITIVSGIIALIYSIIIFMYTLRDSTPGENKYGPNPKESRNFDELQKYNKMFEEGLINEKEFNEMKSKLLKS